MDDDDDDDDPGEVTVIEMANLPPRRGKGGTGGGGLHAKLGGRRWIRRRMEISPSDRTPWTDDTDGVRRTSMPTTTRAPYVDVEYDVVVEKERVPPTQQPENRTNVSVDLAPMVIMMLFSAARENNNNIITR